MAIYKMSGVPRVEAFKGEVALWALPEGEEHVGFVLTPGAAVDVAVACLRVVADLRDERAYSHPVDGMKFEILTRPGLEGEGFLTFRIQGAPVSAHLDATQVAELAAAFTAASRYIDE